MNKSVSFCLFFTLQQTIWEQLHNIYTSYPTAQYSICYMVKSKSMLSFFNSDFLYILKYTKYVKILISDRSSLHAAFRDKVLFICIWKLKGFILSCPIFWSNILFNITVMFENNKYIMSTILHLMTLRKRLRVALSPLSTKNKFINCESKCQGEKF